jgi:preprotein translocase subunit SecA
MIQRVLNKISGDWNQNQLKKYRPLVAQINILDAERESLTDAEIQAKTAEFKARIAAGETTDDLLVEAFATVKQACKRLFWTSKEIKGHVMTWNMIPYDVQLLGWIILHNANIAEMRTWEWKTLVATLPAYLNALTWKWVHVVTVNDYLASRDATWMGHLYEWLWLTVWVVTKQTGQWKTRRAAYEQDITYVENSELGFDYLRDNLTVNRNERTVTARPLHFALIDEVDSILVDEARTPMIISQASGEPTEKYAYYAQLVTLLTPSKGKKKVNKWFLKELLDDVKKWPEEEQDDSGDYWIDEKTKSVTLSTEGIKKLEQLLKVENIYKDLWYQEIHHIENALKAQAVYSKDKEYIIREDEVMLVDDHTWRVMPWRRYSEWLHQAIEAKERVTIQRESQTLATITYQHFFKLYEKLAGMTGTAMTEAEEFEKIYSLPVVQVPTHRPTIRVDKNDMVYFNQNAKWKAVIDYITFYHKIWLPILIWTSSIETSELMSAMLTKMALPHTVLNAKYHEQEANIVMNAGKKGSIVVATNMAWRGTDIKLEADLTSNIAQAYATWIARSISQKQSVSLVVYSELEFDLLVDAMSNELWISAEQIRSAEKAWMNHEWAALKISFNRNKKTKEDAFAEITFSVAESKELIEKDIHFWLFILGTEKHDSRRIDNQLRWRSGRQWDPGVSQFFVAMDDEIMRKMWWDKIQSIARMMLSTEELESLAFTQSQFTNSIQRAQKQMEARHFGIRKHLFEYDSVIDKQRSRIYAKRDSITIKNTEQSEEVVTPEAWVAVELSVIDEIKEFVHEVVDSLIVTYTSTNPWMVDELLEELRTISGVALLADDITTISNVWKLKERLTTIFTDILTTKLSAADEAMTLDICKRIYLSVLDKHRVTHIDEMHYLREKVGLYGYAQMDPLVMYKKEAFEKFQRLLFTIKKETVANVMRFDFAGQQSAQNMAVQLASETNGELDMVEILKEVTRWLATNPTPAAPISGVKKPVQTTVVDGQSAHVVEQWNDVEVIELDDSVATPIMNQWRKEWKLRPNDKVNIQYTDGNFAYGVKWKKVEADVAAGKAKVL